MVVSTRVSTPASANIRGGLAAPTRNFLVAVKFTNRPVNSSRSPGFHPIGTSQAIGPDRQHAKGLISTLNLALGGGAARSVGVAARHWPAAMMGSGHPI
jgi:hypothetical protein